MAKQRPSVRKREREIQKRQRELKKAQKAAAKRERRLNRDRLVSPPPFGGADVAVGQDRIDQRERTDSQEPGITEERELGQA